MNHDLANETNTASISDCKSHDQSGVSGVSSPERALAVNIRKYRKNGIVLACVGLLVIVGVTLLLDRSSYSNFWLLPLLAGIAFLQFEYAANVENEFIGEFQRVRNDDKKATAHEDPVLPKLESAEWINTVIGKLMPIVNTDLLLPVLDLLEDAMMSTFPRIFASVLAAVRIDELDLGVTPFKLVHVKLLDADEPIAENHKPESDSSRFANMEITFAYDGLDRHAASNNLHMITYIAAGVKKWSTVEIPVFAELQSASGTMRVRVELISDPPFIR